MRYDEWGNMVQELDPLDDIGDTSGHVMTFDEYGIFVVKDVNFLTDEQGNRYSLQTQITQNPVWSQIESFIDSTTVRGNDILVEGETFQYAYDEFGRLSNVRYPSPTVGGVRDGEMNPTVTYEYRYDNPVTEIITRHRSESGGDVDRVHIKCVDGFGRLFQERVKISEGQFQVSGFLRRNPRGQVVEQYQAYVSDTATCVNAARRGRQEDHSL